MHVYAVIFIFIPKYLSQAEIIIEASGSCILPNKIFEEEHNACGSERLIL